MSEEENTFQKNVKEEADIYFKGKTASFAKASDIVAASVSAFKAPVSVSHGPVTVQETADGKGAVITLDVEVFQQLQIRRRLLGKIATALASYVAEVNGVDPRDTLRKGPVVALLNTIHEQTKTAHVPSENSLEAFPAQDRADGSILVMQMTDPETQNVRRLFEVPDKMILDRAAYLVSQYFERRPEFNASSDASGEKE